MLLRKKRIVKGLSQEYELAGHMQRETPEMILKLLRMRRKKMRQDEN